MSYHYGSDSLEIKNPYKQEGLLFLISGSLILLIGIVSIFTLRAQIIESGLAAGWFNLVVSLVLLTGGINYIAQGIIKISRFYVGRGVPTSLAKNMARSEQNTEEPNAYYSSQELEQMIMGRKNITFKEPNTLFERVVYSIYPKFIFLPYSMRSYLNLLIRNIGYSIIGFLVYLIALFSGTIGLTLLTDSSFSQWLGIGLCIFLLSLWIEGPFNGKKINHKNLYNGNNKSIALTIIFAVLVPILGELLLRLGINFPKAPFNPAFTLISLYILSTATLVAVLILSRLRAEVANPVTEVSEYRNHWQENVHPKDFFRALDMEMANLRYKEIPNRVYRELNPSLNIEGSINKGSFYGDTIQETQPRFEDIPYPPLLGKVRLFVAVVGHFLVALSALLLFIIKQGGAEGINFAGLFIPVLLLTFGASLQTLAHLYWGEIQFSSILIQFQGDGTYSESKLSVGMAITDSTRSENTVVRTSYSPWFLITRIVTTTQARSGSNPLNQGRYILSMEKADVMLDHLVEKMRYFLEDREFIAATSKKDLKTIQSFYTTNETSTNSKIPIKKSLNNLLNENNQDHERSNMLTNSENNAENIEPVEPGQ